MHNWRLLLLAFLAVLQPIAAFAERNLVDGREQRCDRNSLLRDSRLSYGTFRSNKLSEDRRLSRADIREDRRYEVSRDHAVLTRPSTDRRLVERRSESEAHRNSPEPTARFARTQYRRESIVETRYEIPNERDSRVRDHRIISRDINRDVRSQDVARMRHSRETNIRQHVRINREFAHDRASDEQIFTRNDDAERRFRASVDSRRETRGNSVITEEHRNQEVRETREVLQRARPDVTRDGMSRRSMQERRNVRERVELEDRRARSESRLQLNNDKGHRFLDRRERDDSTERRSFLRSTNTMDRTQNARDHRRNVRDEREYSRRETVEGIDKRRHLERDDRRVSRDRTFVRRDQRDRSSAERRYVRNSVDRSRTIENRNTRGESRVDERRFSVVNRQQRVSDTDRVDVRKITEGRDAASDRGMERRERRMTDRRDVRDSRHQVQDRDVDARERKDLFNRADHTVTKYAERALNQERLRTNVRFLLSENVAFIREKTQTEKSSLMSWQYVLYALQGIYLCGILVQIISHKESYKKPRGLSWLTAPRSLIKMD